MDTVIKALFSLSALLVLLAINLWAFRVVWHSFAAEDAPDAIAPIKFVGKEDPGGKRGQALANMLLARLARVRQEINATALQLRADSPAAPRGRIETLDYAGSLSLPDRLFEPINIEMKLGGVEVGGVITWIQNWLSQQNMLQISIESDETNARVAAVWDGGRRSLWFETAAKDEKIVSVLAYALTQREFAKNIREIEALSVDEFQNLLLTLNELVGVQQSAAYGRRVDREYESLFERLDDLVEKTPRWAKLQRVGAELAEKSGNYHRAVDLYSRELALNDGAVRDKPFLEARIQDLKEKLKIATTSEVLPPTAPITHVTPGWPLNALGVTSLAMSRSPSVAVLGGLPLQGTLPDSQQVITAAPPSMAQPAEGEMAEYMRTVVQAVQLVAPQTKFVLTPMDTESQLGFSKAEVIAAIDRLTAANPDILLITLGPLTHIDERRAIERAVMKGVVVVVAAGNERGQPIEFAETGGGRELMIVSATDRDGQKASFTQFAEGVFWAPGRQIPVRPKKTKKVELRDGTTYAAALAAGVVARILAEYPNLERGKLFSTLRETADFIKPGVGERILRLNEALTKLASA